MPRPRWVRSRKRQGPPGVFAEFERAMIQKRVRAGLRRAKAQGTTTQTAIRLALAKRDQGMRKIAAALRSATKLAPFKIQSPAQRSGLPLSNAESGQGAGCRSNFFETCPERRFWPAI